MLLVALLGTLSVATMLEPRIECMEMIGGVPQEPVIYMLRASGELTSSSNDDKAISDFKEMPLSVTTEGKSFARHEWIKKGAILRRTVRNEGKSKSRFVEIYDFAHQTIKDEAGEDSCHHDRYKAP